MAKQSARKKLSANTRTCPPSPGVREPISVAISFDLLRKKRAMMQKASGSHGMTMTDKKERVTPVFVV
ncbi:hypothetical protein [Absidia glauca]|uniref:Uncharacterized protein n=1 Tax=Absidia glauca TaxID=4829 RepID=A0A168PYV4_ABSGL|nr:hypothetical protein [Absidia glauca]